MKTCAFPLWWIENESPHVYVRPTHQYCGKPVTREKFSYCEEHMQVCYDSKRTNVYDSKARIPKMKVEKPIEEKVEKTVKTVSEKPQPKPKVEYVPKVIIEVD